MSNIDLLAHSSNEIEAAQPTVRKGVSWADVAKVVGGSKEWVTAGCLGQMTFNKTQAAALASLFDLDSEAQSLLQVSPYRGSLPTAVPSDPLIYRFYELLSVYGTTLNENFLPKGSLT